MVGKRTLQEWRSADTLAVACAVKPILTLKRTVEKDALDLSRMLTANDCPR